MKDRTENILKQILDSGFDEVCVTLTGNQVDELNIAHNKASLMRSTESETLDIVAIRDHRKVTAATSSTEPEALGAVIEDLVRDAETTPADEANAVASDQTGRFVKGPLEADLESMVRGADRLLDFRSSSYPAFQIEEASLSHNLKNIVLMSSQGCHLELSHGFYSLRLMGSSKDALGSSSFNSTGGLMDSVPGDLQNHFDIQTVLDNSVQETVTSRIDEKFTGDVILMPNAVSALLKWLFGQLGDYNLLQDTSLYKDAAGTRIADECLNLSHIMEGSGVVPFNSEGFLLEPFRLLEKGQLHCLLPSFYGSRKMGIPYKPPGRGWEITSGEITREDMISCVQRGALVGRLSMGSPAANGDFSGVIKNSFLLQNGRRGKALGETMITGNIARMLRDITAVSREATNFGTGNIPWLLIRGLQFS